MHRLPGLKRFPLTGLTLIAGLLTMEGPALAQCASGPGGGGAGALAGGGTAQTSFSRGGGTTAGGSTSGLMSLASQAMQLQMQMVQARQQQMARQQELFRRQQFLRQQEIRNLTSVGDRQSEAGTGDTPEAERPAEQLADQPTAEEVEEESSPPAMTKRERLIARLKERAAARQEIRLKRRHAAR